jgi:hypothetical protein
MPGSFAAKGHGLKAGQLTPLLCADPVRLPDEPQDAVVVEAAEK